MYSDVFLLTKQILNTKNVKMHFRYSATLSTGRAKSASELVVVPWSIKIFTSVRT